jgi:hypothetical protein
LSSGNCHDQTLIEKIDQWNEKSLDVLSKSAGKTAFMCLFHEDPERPERTVNKNRVPINQVVIWSPDVM